MKLYGTKIFEAWHLPASMRWLIALLLLPSVAMAASISGTVYDLSLEEVTALVTIDTEPEQRIVAQQGEYSFEVGPGRYTLSAKASIDREEWSVSENLTIRDDGQYHLDLILAPSFEDIDDLGLEEEPLSDITNTKRSVPMWPFIVLPLLVVGAIVYYVYNRKPTAEQVKQEDEYRDAVLLALRKHKGRITQKQLRQEVQFSEAKVSLVLTELESEGKIKKIKKGRGNVILLK